MTTRHPDALVADYLRRLAAAAAALPPDRQTELVAEIQAHIAEALEAAGAAADVAVRNVLERLGSPEEIAAAAAGPPTGPPQARGKLEIAALLVLALGGVLPIVGWAVGVVLVLASEAWSCATRSSACCSACCRRSSWWRSSSCRRIRASSPTRRGAASVRSSGSSSPGAL